MNRRWTPLLLLALLSIPIRAADLSAIRASVREEMKDAIPGAGVVIVAGGKPLLVEGFGTTSAEHPMRFRADAAGPMETFVLIPRTDGRPEFLTAEVWALRRVEES
jgi:hypothetical protein